MTKIINLLNNDMGASSALVLCLVPCVVASVVLSSPCLVACYRALASLVS